jgi:hypothetical protein
MKTESNIKPNKFEIEYTAEDTINNKCDVIFNTNIVEEKIREDEEITMKYVYNTYRLTVNYRENLEQILEDEEKYEKWLELAKNTEYKAFAQKIRATRDKLLAETDWTQVTDTVLNKEKQEEYKIYRQKLRDITGQEEFPYNVTFPEMPI